MTLELSKDELIWLIKGTEGYQSYSTAVELEKMGAGKLTGFPNERWYWNNRFFQVRSEQQLYDFYLLLKSWINEKGQKIQGL